jgi:AbrB family looped-hinge helix DNA binding protein
MKRDIEFKTIKISSKGQIAIPVDMQREIGIKKGDELLLIRKGNKIVLEKTEKIAKKIEDEFKDVHGLSEQSLKKLWLNKKDEIWNEYLKRGKK